MASSSYWKSKYNEQCSLVKKYQKNIESLNGILSNITNGLPDNITDINKKIDELKSDLNSAVGHDSAYTRNANDLSSAKEKTVYQDPNISGAKSDIQDEIRHLQKKKSEAESLRDQYNRNYQNALEEERREREERERERREREKEALNNFISGISNLFR